MGKKKFIDKKLAQHFTLVHRSQHDPLVADGEASNYVLLPIKTKNSKKSSTTEATEEPVYDSDESKESLENAARAAQFGLFFGDGYDYCQHLKPMGEASDAVFIAPPSIAKEQEKAKKKVSFQLPEDVLPSKVQNTFGLMNQPAIPEEYDFCMDPTVIDALEALEDEAYIDAELDDQFFSSINNEQVLSEDEQEEGELDPDAGWEEHFRRFKNSSANNYSDDEVEEKGSFKVADYKTTASKYSMTSSAMFRNKGLTFLDEQFDKVEEEYDENDDSEDESCPELTEIREDFDKIMDDFLENYEVVGRRMVPKVGGETSADKFSDLRESFLGLPEDRENNQKTILSALEGELPEVEEEEEEEEPSKDTRWDCESILSTYSNIFNHPSLIVEPVNRAKVRLNKHGFPRLELPVVEESSDDEEGESDQKARLDNSRSKEESKEEKKMRKNLSKELKKERREQKKLNKQVHQNLAKQRQHNRKNCAASHAKAISLD